VKFTRLRISGFKSFVEPTELYIEPGLTAIVGPNGCGKSNLFDALRWVMGENRPTSVRGSEMDDVIFAGSAGRPPRNVAEVTLAIDNADRTANPPYQDFETIEVSRRIEREAGSVYRINGRDARQRDVQIFFADASSGAASTAFVRQGMIGQLVSQKPLARRAILEEAAGISGLHQRRHEAELRLKAAEGNLSRLDDVIKEVETQLASLKRQARQASRYRNLSGHIRRAESLAHYLRWTSAQLKATAAQEAMTSAVTIVEEATQIAATASTVQANAAEAMPPLREIEAERAAILTRLIRQREELDAEETRARELAQSLRQRIAQNGADLEREHGLRNDAETALAALIAELNELEAAQERAGVELAEADQKNGEMNSALYEAERLLEKLQADLAERNAKVASLERQRRVAADLAENNAVQLQAAENRLTEAQASAAADPDVGAAEEAVAEARRLAETATELAEAARAEFAVLDEAERTARSQLENTEKEARATFDAAERDARTTAEAAERDARAALEAVDRDGRGAIENAEREGRAALETAEREGRAAIENADRDGRAAVENAEREGRAAIDLIEREGRAAIDAIERDGRAAINAIDTEGRAKLDTIDREGRATLATIEREGRARIEEADTTGRARIDEADREGRAAIEEADTNGRAALETIEREKRTELENAERELTHLTTEASALQRILAASGENQWPPLLDAVNVQSGYEGALAAALGDELQDPLDEASPRHWRDLADYSDPVSLPVGARPLSYFVTGPHAMSRRLAMTGVVFPDQGAALQAELKPGQRLVSPRGDLWRWDGYRASADAPSASAVRLEQKNRLAELEGLIATAKDIRDAAAEAYTTAKTEAEEAYRAAKSAAVESHQTTKAAVEEAHRTTKAEAEQAYATAKADAEQAYTSAKTDAEQFYSAAKAEAEQSYLAAKTEAEQSLQVAKAEAEARYLATKAAAEDAYKAARSTAVANYETAKAQAEDFYLNASSAAEEAFAVTKVAAEATYQDAKARADEIYQAAKQAASETYETVRIAAEQVYETAKGQAEVARQALRSAEQDERNAAAGIMAAQDAANKAAKQAAERAQQLAALEAEIKRIAEAREAALENERQAAAALEELGDGQALIQSVDNAREVAGEARNNAANARATLENLKREGEARERRLAVIAEERTRWDQRNGAAAEHIGDLESRQAQLSEELVAAEAVPASITEKRGALLDAIGVAEVARKEAGDKRAEAETLLAEADRTARTAEHALSAAREERARAEAVLEGDSGRLTELVQRIRDELDCAPEELAERAEIKEDEELPPIELAERKVEKLKQEREALGGVNLRAEEEATELETRLTGLTGDRDDLIGAIERLRRGIQSLNREGRERLLEAYEKVNTNFQMLFSKLFEGGEAKLTFTESEDPLEAGLEIFARPPGKRLQSLALLSGGEQALTAMSLIFAVFLVNPAPVCVLDEVDAPLDDANVERFCNMLEEMTKMTDTRFLVITHHALTMSRMHRLFGVTMAERGVSQLVSVSLAEAERAAAE
jgi:chromosome segregation protein